MSKQTEHKVDRTGWVSGPWDSEPDRIEWRDEKTGLPCLMVRVNSHGAWCGYVGLPPGHRYHRVDYDAVPAEVHGGLTYASECSGHICHVAREGESDKVWWLGFDCVHYGDMCPGHFAFIDRGGSGEYRNAAYVRAEVTRLAEQLA